MYELRPYQQECVDIVRNLPDGSKALIVMATALGKTVTFSQFPRKGRMLILSHRDELVRQPEKYFSDTTFGIEKADIRSNGEDVVSASVQSLFMPDRLLTFKPDAFDMIIIDEAHHATSAMYQRILGYFKPRLLIGVTATPIRSDNISLRSVFDGIIFERNLFWGIENKWLCPFSGRTIRTDVDISDVTIMDEDYDVRLLERAVNVPKMVKAVSDAYIESAYRKRHSTLIFCISVHSANNVMESIRSQVDPCDRERIQMITGKTSLVQRRQFIDDFKTGKILALLNCQVLTEGTDLSNTDCIIVGRPCCSSVMYTQIVGRGLRLDDTKSDCLILDVIPKGGRKLCTVASLLGLNWDEAPDRFRDKIAQKNLSYSELQALVDQIENQVYDSVVKACEKATKVGSKDRYVRCGNDSRSLYRERVYETRSFLSQIASLTEPAMDFQGKMAGINSFFGIQTFRGQTEDAAFIVRGKANDFEFHFSTADSNGKLMVTA